MRDLIREYFEVVQSLTADDRAGEQLARNIWLRMTPQQQAEARRLHREPCRGYDESCRPCWTAAT